MPTKIPLSNGGSKTNLELADLLDRIALWLDDRAEQIYACDCEEDSENITGSYEYDTGAYNHGQYCPTWKKDHNRIVIESAAEFFRETKTIQEVANELVRARSKHPNGIYDIHKAVGVILEEYREFEQEAFKQNIDRQAIRKELLQLATMCIRAIEDLEL